MLLLLAHRRSEGHVGCQSASLVQTSQSVSSASEHHVSEVHFSHHHVDRCTEQVCVVEIWYVRSFRRTQATVYARTVKQTLVCTTPMSVGSSACTRSFLRSGRLLHPIHTSCSHASAGVLLACTSSHFTILLHLATCISILPATYI